MPRPSFRMEWDAHEYEHKVRSSDWFWAVGIVAVALAIAAIIFKNIILSILILVGAFALTIFAKRPPNSVRVVVDERGIVRGKVFYPYSTLESFWIDTEHTHKKIILRSEKMLMPLIVVPLNDEVNIDTLHENLSSILKEEFHALPFVEKILEYFGF